MKIDVFQSEYPLLQPRSAVMIADHPADRGMPGGAASYKVGPEQESPQAEQSLLQAVEAANAKMKELDLDVRLRVGEKTERLQVEIYNAETKEVIRRFPPDEIIKLAESIDQMAGLMLNRSL